MVQKSGARIAKTRAVLEDAHTLRLMTGEKVTAKYILIATGGAPNHGREIPGIEHVISSNEAFHLTELPKRIVIQGGGYIALEFAGIFAGFGSDVTVIYRGDNILRGFDEDVRIGPVLPHLGDDVGDRSLLVPGGNEHDGVRHRTCAFDQRSPSASRRASRET